ncbi:hypothetical protein [Terriglobus aquaticus]|uniref:Uncharacterized protein n=1 Tax=Terriglobus aquaticus TaxID=940139 RepID=A0ABW9KPW6_9BACT|nr:hypothetical protein [Terriglobus aquaticus]
MTTANLEQAKSSLESHQTSFNDIVKQPNTLERNVVLAEHRSEIGRLQKLIAKSTKL